MSKFRLQLWVAWRYLRGSGAFVNTTSSLSFFGMAAGVACLVVAMAVVSGFETTLKRTVVDAVGEITLIRSGGGVQDVAALEKKVFAAEPRVRFSTPFVHLEGLVAFKGQFQGVVLQGFDPATLSNVLNLQGHLREGEFRIEDGVRPTLLVGKGMAEKLKIRVGDQVQVVIPRVGTREDQPFLPRSQKFEVTGILDFGKYDYDLRFAILNIKTAQEFRTEPGTVTGLRLKLEKSDQARDASFQLGKELGSSYWLRDWREVNENLFAAIQLEKIVIFLIPLFMVIAAGFNIASTLYIAVLKRFQDVAVLKTLGASSWFIVWLFSLQGLFVGFFGALTGLGLGWGLCKLLVHSSLHWIPAEIYKLDRLNVEFRGSDLAAILGASMLICFISTLAPAFQASRLKPVEGLRYE